MAGKVSTLTWDAPPNGGSDITSYRVLVYEADQQVDALTSDQPGVQVTASETVERTALIQALNDLGYSAPAMFAIPIGSDTATTPIEGGFLLSGGGYPSFTGRPPSTTPTPVPPTIAVTRVDETSSRIIFSSPGDQAWADVRVLLNGFTINGATAPGDVITVSGQHTIQLKLLYGSDYNYVTPLSNLVTVPAYVAPTGDPSLTITRGGDGRLTFSVATSLPGPIALYFYSSANNTDGLFTGNVPNPYTADLDGYTGPEAVAAFPKWRVRVNGVSSDYTTTPS